MRLLKMLGLAALVAVAAMAIAGAGTAFAKGAGNDTVLCAANQHPCAAGNIKPAGQAISAQSANTKLKLSIPFVGTKEVACEESQVEGKTKEEKGQKGTSGTELEGEITRLTFEKNCHVVGTTAKCTVTSVQLNYQALLEQEGNTTNGHLFVFEHANGEQPGAIVACEPVVFTVNCEFKGAEENTQNPGVQGVNLQVTGGNPATVTANQAQLKQVKVPGHESCPGTEPKWDGTYTVHIPQPVWVSQA
jgi:hypothetical protein